MKIFIYFGCVLVFSFVHFIIVSLVFKEKITKNNFVPKLLPTIVFAFCASLFYTAVDIFLLQPNFNILFIAIISSSVIMSYWFYIAPIFHLIKRKSQQRDYFIEEELAKNNYNFKVVLSDEVVSNAFATGGLPYMRIIIIAKNLKDVLNYDELMAVVYHEVGHHKRNHIFKLFCIHVFLNTLLYLVFDCFFKIEMQQPFETFGVAGLGALAGLVFYFIPNKFLFYFEYEADSFAVSQVGVTVVANALVSMNKKTEGQLEKGNINHPPLNLRLNHIKNVSNSAKN